MKRSFFRSIKDKNITVVSGLPRSGTSLMMKMLAAGGLVLLTDQLRVADEDNPEGYYEFERVKKLNQGDTAWLEDAQGKVVKVIATLLPNLPASYFYRIIFMTRAMPEILASQRKMLVNRGQDPDKISDEELSRLFQKHLNQVDGWIKSQPHIERIDVSYNQLVLNPQPDIDRINQFLGGRLDTKRMVEVINPDLYRQRKG